MECKVDHSDYKNNGLITKLWGQAGWDFNHAVTYGYPLEPTEEQINNYRNYFVSLGYVLPCGYCRDSYQKFITTGETALTNEDLKDRISLTRWFKRVHDAVNVKLEVEYAIDQDDLDKRFENFRAKCGKPIKTEKGCVTPLDQKAIAFQKLYYRDAPIIHLETIRPFIKIAEIRGLDQIYFTFIPLAELLDGDFSKLKKQECWVDRNNFCCGLIKWMRANAVPSIEEDGPWKGTPTLDELKLLMFLSSNLNKSELTKVREKVLSSIDKF